MLQELYTYLVLSVAGGLLTLLGSVGIFISLIVQRRLDRLQDVLEEFINLSYRSEVNLTSQMYNLIEKYQMHYLFPQKPRLMILRYIDLNIFFILLLWVLTASMFYKPPFSPFLIIQVIPLGIGIYAALFFRRLLRNTINLKNPLLENIIPAPTKLRSISFLSHFINISVKSILKQARLTILLKYQEADDETKIKVFLKEELSFDDFFYYFLLSEKDNPLFISFGEICFNFPPDQITGKPVPACRNLNIPLGDFLIKKEPETLTARLLIFTHGEKHPVQYLYHLSKGTRLFSSHTHPEITINHQIIYSIEANRLKLIEAGLKIPYFEELSPHFYLQNKRCYLAPIISNEPLEIKTCREEVFID